MKASFLKSSVLRVGIPVVSMMLSGCNYALLDPKGIVGVQIKELILTALLLMLIVVIPVILMTIYFAFRFRASNQNEKYMPEWSHSNKIEFVVWAVPIVIIVILATITWRSTHHLEPSKPLVHDQKPLLIEVVAMDWKWLFIYPEQKIAMINYTAFPKDRPVEFKLTSDKIMNSFFIPRLGSQLYAMPGMVTRLNLIANEAGEYKGVSISYSGDGFSDMKFTANALDSQQAFDDWVQSVRMMPNLTAIRNFNDYLELAKPSINVPVTYYAGVPDNLFSQVVMQFEGSMNHAFGEESESMGSHDNHHDSMNSHSMPMPVDKGE